MCQMAVTQIQRLKTLAQNWLFENQDDSGGWAERPGSSVNILNTAEVMLALFASGIDGGNASIHEAAKYLLSQGRDVPIEDRGAWGRDVRHDESIEHIP